MSFLDSLFGPPNVERLKEKGDVKGLIKALSYDDDYTIRNNAQKALEEIGDSRVIELLIVTLKHKYKYARSSAAESLGKIGGSIAVEPLINVVKDRNEDDYVCHSAAIALGDIGDKRAVEPLIYALKYRYDYTRGDIVNALRKIGDKRAVEPLILLLKDERHSYSASTSSKIVCALGNFGDKRAVEPLLNVLFIRHNDNDVYSDTVKALEKIGCEPDNLENKIICWLALGRWTECVKLGSSAIEPLSHAFKYRWYGGAIRALEEIGDERAVKSLINVLYHEKPYDEESYNDDKESYKDVVCWDVISALERIGSKSGKESNMIIDAFISTLHVGKLISREMSAEALGNIGDDKAVEHLILILGEDDEYYSDLRYKTISALVKLGSSAVKPLIVAIKDENERKRRGAIEALSKN